MSKYSFPSRNGNAHGWPELTVYQVLTLNVPIVYESPQQAGPNTLLQ